jgi:hypothetical protein
MRLFPCKKTPLFIYSPLQLFNLQIDDQPGDKSSPKKVLLQVDGVNFERVVQEYQHDYYIFMNKRRHDYLLHCFYMHPKINFSLYNSFFRMLVYTPCVGHHFCSARRKVCVSSRLQRFDLHMRTRTLQWLCLPFKRVERFHVPGRSQCWWLHHFWYRQRRPYNGHHVQHTWMAKKPTVAKSLEIRKYFLTN